MDVITTIGVLLFIIYTMWLMDLMPGGAHYEPPGKP